MGVNSTIMTASPCFCQLSRWIRQKRCWTIHD